MKTNYSILPKHWLHLGLTTALSTSLIGLQAQTAPPKQWDKAFGGNDNEWFNSLQQTSDGGFILGGASFSGIGGDKSHHSQGNLDYWIVKLDAAGNKVWDKTFGGNATDQLFSIQQTHDGGYILGGESNSGISGDKSEALLGIKDYWIVKLDANGTKQWDKTFGGNNEELFYSIKQTQDGGYILGGSSRSGIGSHKSQPVRGSAHHPDYWIVKIDANGNKQWDKTLGGASGEKLYSIELTFDGGYILGGISDSELGDEKSENGRGASDYWVVKIDATGNKLWDKTFGGNNSEFLLSAKQTSDGGYILGGTSLSGISSDKSMASKGGDDFWLLKLDSNGNKIWDNSFGGSHHDFLYSLQQTLDGGYIMGGYSYSDISSDKSQASLGSSDYWILKLNANGHKIWDIGFGGNGSDHLLALQQTADGSFVLGGTSDSGISGNKSAPSQGGYDFWIVKLGPEILGTTKPQPTFNLSISPNPNQGKFKLQLSNLTTSTTEVTITDLLGRVILQKQLPVTGNQLSEELEIKAANGMYLLTVQTGIETLTRKIVIE